MNFKGAKSIAYPEKLHLRAKKKEYRTEYQLKENK